MISSCARLPGVRPIWPPVRITISPPPADRTRRTRRETDGPSAWVRRCKPASRIARRSTTEGAIQLAGGQDPIPEARSSSVVSTTLQPRPVCLLSTSRRASDRTCAGSLTEVVKSRPEYIVDRAGRERPPRRRHQIDDELECHPRYGHQQDRIAGCHQTPGRWHASGRGAASGIERLARTSSQDGRPPKPSARYLAPHWCRSRVVKGSGIQSRHRPG